MKKPTFERPLVLSPEERIVLVTALAERYDTLGNDDSDDTVIRYEYPQPDIKISADQPAGGTSHFFVYGHTLSRRDLILFHSGYMHPKSDCQLVLRTATGESFAVQAVTARCEHLKNRWHVVLVTFRKKLDPALFVTNTQTEEEAVVGVAAGQEQVQRLNGNVVLAEYFEPGRNLLEWELRELGLAPKLASTPGATLDAVQREAVDVVILGAGALTDAELRTIQRLREMKYTNPIVVLVADNSPTAAMRAQQAGATTVLPRPCDQNLLIAELQIGLQLDQPEGPFRSTVASIATLQPQLKTFVPFLHRTADQLAKFLETFDLEKLRLSACWLRACGHGYGFTIITTAATAVMHSVDRNDSDDELQQCTERLIDCCRATELRPQRRNAA